MTFGWVLVFIAAAAGCSKETVSPAQEPFQIMHDFTMTQTVERRTLWKLSAPIARIALDGASELDNPVVEFYREGSHASTANADRAAVSPGSTQVHLEGDVVIKAHREKVTLKTEKLDYRADKDRIRTEEDVLIERPGATVRGKGMEADSALNDITIFKQRTVIQ